MKLSLPLQLLLGVLIGSKVSTAEDEQCGLYMAISSATTAEVTKWGIYAGKQIAANTMIGFPEVAINLPNLKANNILNSDDEDEDEFRLRVADFFESFMWVPDPAGAKFDLARGRSVTAIPGSGSLGGHNPELTNAAWNETAAYYREALGEVKGWSHPGRGASSPFFNIVLKSNQVIEAGREIFLDYGDNYEESEEENKLSPDDYSKIDETVDHMLQFFEKHKDALDEEAKIEIYRFIARDVMNAALGSEKGSRVTNLLPNHPDALVDVKKTGSMAYSHPSVHRSVEWLSEHGKCMDNMKPGASTIKGAGRGAFASRPIQAGHLVAPVPLIHIPDKNILDMHDLKEGEDGELSRAHDEVRNHQLLVNYCLGHPESSMFFFPAGAGVGLINHSEEPNAKLVWSDHPGNRKDWFELTPFELAQPENHYIGLMMEVVATKDIKEGEEIFIDYGPEWSKAWARHEETWKKGIADGKIPNEWPARAVDMNQEYKNKPLKTEQELESDPYPEFVQLKAFMMILNTPNEGTEEDPKMWGELTEGQAFAHENIFDVVVVGVTEVPESDSTTTYKYKIRWTNAHGDHTYVQDVPHKAFFFLDAPETGDQFFPNTFRHPIGIPDDVFPKGIWRDVTIAVV